MLTGRFGPMALSRPSTCRAACTVPARSTQAAPLRPARHARCIPARRRRLRRGPRAGAPRAPRAPAGATETVGQNHHHPGVTPRARFARPRRLRRALSGRRGSRHRRSGPLLPVGRRAPSLRIIGVMWSGRRAPYPHNPHPIMRHQRAYPCAPRWVSGVGTTGAAVARVAPAGPSRQWPSFSGSVRSPALPRRLRAGPPACSALQRHIRATSGRQISTQRRGGPPGTTLRVAPGCNQGRASARWSGVTASPTVAVLGCPPGRPRRAGSSAAERPAPVADAFRARRGGGNQTGSSTQ